MTTEAETEVAAKPILRVKDDVVEAWVKKALSTYKVLSGIRAEIHWSGQFIAICSRMDYEAPRHLFANTKKVAEIPGYLGILQKHMSQEILDDLEAQIELAESDSRVEVLTLHDTDGKPAEGVMYVDGGHMSYTEKELPPVDLNQSDNPNWGSW